MAAMSAAPVTASAFSSATPGSAHGNGDSNGYHAWNNGISSPGNDEQNQMQPNKRAAPTNHSYEGTNGYSRSPLVSQNGNSNPISSRRDIDPVSDPFASSSAMAGAGYLSPSYDMDRPIRPPPASIKDGASPADSLLELYSSGNKSAKRSNVDLSPVDDASVEDESSKWIHRDKLARIESEELQAAGIILPTTRARSRPRHNNTHDRGANGTKRAAAATDSDGGYAAAGSGRSRKDSEATVGEARNYDIPIPSWDLRLPEEIIETNYWTAKGSSRIPVAKSSPVPIPNDYLERETPATRKRDSSPDEGGSIRMPKTRARSSSTSTKPDAPSSSSTNAPSNPPAAAPQQPKRAVTDSSPKKNPAPTTRKASAPTKANGPSGRPKTRGGPSKDSTGSSTGGATTRPSTRSGERELSPSSGRQQPPEGEPPWMVSAYKPDPRLPPDQQLLPTVARRLQQEKWEREGKFGSIYDKEFRPLTNDGLLAPPEPKIVKDEEKQPDDQSPHQLSEEWPLKPEPRSPTSPGLRQQRTGSYTTIPKIQDPPVSPIPPGSRGNMAPGMPSPFVRVPDAPADDPKQKEKGCMCCVVM